MDPEKTGLPYRSKPYPYGGTGSLVKLDNYEFSSCFDGGNMLDVVSSTTTIKGSIQTIYNVYCAQDCHGSLSKNHFRMWYYFSVKGGMSGDVIRLRVMNLNRVSVVYNQDLNPSVKVIPSVPSWKRHEGTVRYLLTDKDLQLYFEHQFVGTQDTVFFSFVKPYTYSDCQDLLNYFDCKFIQVLKREPTHPIDPINAHRQVYYYRETVTRSLDGLPIDLVTVTSRRGLQRNHELPHDGLFLEGPRPLLCEGKRTIFIGARVHPGEAPASQMMESILKFLLDEDDGAAAALRDKYVFKVIPMLNPDGVRRGYYRSNTMGINLNRAWENPTLVTAPSIFASKAIIETLSSLFETERGKQDGVFMCIDIHAFACRPGYYILGNSLPHHQMVESITFTKIISQISKKFNFDACSFPSMKKNKKRESCSNDLRALDAHGGMSIDTIVRELRLWSTIKDKESSGFKTSKAGTGRVALFREFGISHSYTIECSCNPYIDTAAIGEKNNWDELAEEMAKLRVRSGSVSSVGSSDREKGALPTTLEDIKLGIPAMHQFQRDDDVHYTYGKEFCLAILQLSSSSDGGGWTTDGRGLERAISTHQTREWASQYVAENLLTKKSGPSSLSLKKRVSSAAGRLDKELQKVFDVDFSNSSSIASATPLSARKSIIPQKSPKSLLYDAVEVKDSNLLRPLRPKPNQSISLANSFSLIGGSNRKVNVGFSGVISSSTGNNSKDRKSVATSILTIKQPFAFKNSSVPENGSRTSPTDDGGNTDLPFLHSNNNNNHNRSLSSNSIDLKVQSQVNGRNQSDPSDKRAVVPGGEDPQVPLRKESNILLFDSRKKSSLISSKKYKSSAKRF